MTKKPAPPATLVQNVEKLFQIAAVASAKPPKLQTSISTDKLFELRVLARLLRLYKSKTSGAKIKHIPPTHKGAGDDVIVVPLNPASANQKKYSHFDLTSGVGDEYVAWISVETKTLSWSMTKPIPVPLAAFHELDVAIFQKPIGLYPEHDDICVAVSCKNVMKVQKESVREALGMKRETALLTNGLRGQSRAPWLIPSVPTNPSSPVLLVSSDPGIRKYRHPVDSHGVYVRYLHFFT